MSNRVGLYCLLGVIGLAAPVSAVAQSWIATQNNGRAMAVVRTASGLGMGIACEGSTPILAVSLPAQVTPRIVNLTITVAGRKSQLLVSRNGNSQVWGAALRDRSLLDLIAAGEGHATITINDRLISTIPLVGARGATSTSLRACYAPSREARESGSAPVLSGADAGAGPGAASLRVAAAPVVQVSVRGASQARFGPSQQWKLVIDPATKVPGENTNRLGDVRIESIDGRRRYTLAEPEGYSEADTGDRCTIQRILRWAIIQCASDYVFDTEGSSPPRAITPKFSDRDQARAPGNWALDLPLPWWRPTGLVLPSTTLAVLDYGETNYGRLVDTTRHLIGPALLDLESGYIARAHGGASPRSPVYNAVEEAYTATNQPVAAIREGDVATLSSAGGSTRVGIAATFARCPDQGCTDRKSIRPQGRRTLFFFLPGSLTARELRRY